jgi:hypothetical protein
MPKSIGSDLLSSASLVQADLHIDAVAGEMVFFGRWEILPSPAREYKNVFRVVGLNHLRQRRL